MLLHIRHCIHLKKNTCGFWWPKGRLCQPLLFSHQSLSSLAEFLFPCGGNRFYCRSAIEAVPQCRKHRPVSIRLKANALLIFAMHKPWAMCKQTPGSLTWSAISLGQVSPHPIYRECVALLVAHVKDTGAKQLGRTPLFIIMLFLASLNKEGSRIFSLSNPSFYKICWENCFCILLSHRNACPVTKLFLLFLLQNHTMTQHSS